MTPTRTENRTAHLRLDSYINGLPTESHRKIATTLAEHYYAGGDELQEPPLRSKKVAREDINGMRDRVLLLTAEMSAENGDPTRLMRLHFARINRALAAIPFGGSANFQYVNVHARHAGTPDATQDLAGSLKLVADNLERLRRVLELHVETDSTRDAKLRERDSLASTVETLLLSAVERNPSRFKEALGVKDFDPRLLDSRA